MLHVTALYGHVIMLYGRVMVLYGHVMALYGHVMMLYGHVMVLYSHVMVLYSHVITVIVLCVHPCTVHVCVRVKRVCHDGSLSSALRNSRGKVQWLSATVAAE